jgi:hypothetical protein
MVDHPWESLVQTLLALWTTAKASPVWALAIAFAPIAALAVKATKSVAAAVKWMQSKRAAAVGAALLAKTHVQSFSDEDISSATNHYVEPDCSNVDPANERDLRRVIGVREPVYSTIDRALQTDAKTHLMVLADSGMGKTTFLLNFFAREQGRPERLRRPMALIPLSRSDGLDQIKAVVNKRGTMLLLDALDEDTKAIEDYRSRLDQLMAVSADFKAVVLTCRTQFFASDADIPTETGIARVSPRRAGTSGTHEFRKVYLMPFTEVQIRLYVRSLFPFWRPDRRARAMKVVRRIPELSVRPMLLALLPELMQRHDDLRELWDLYTFMVASWLQRESNWILPEKLRADSQRIAADLVLNRNKRDTERIDRDELASLLDTSAEKIEEWKLTTRSLLNRDAMGQFKFAHRSIMEFLFVRSFIEGDDACATVQWTDMMCDLFLSWGRSSAAQSSHDAQRIDHLLLEVDLSRTGLFPVVYGGEPASTLDSNWAKSALNPSGSVRDRAGVPPLWRRLTSRYIASGDEARAYEFAEGLAWQYINTTTVHERQERELYRVGRHERLWRSDDGTPWSLPMLSEFRSLVESLQTHGHSDLDDRELYWLADEDQSHVSMARVRPAADRTLQPTHFPGGAELVFSGQVGSAELGSIVDVYRIPKIQISRGSEQSVPAPQAQAIRTCRGDAQALWNADRMIAQPTWLLSAVSETLFGKIAIEFAEERRRNLRRPEDL